MTSTAGPIWAEAGRFPSVASYRLDCLYGWYQWLNSFRFGNANCFADVIACTHKQVIACTLLLIIHNTKSSKSFEELERQFEPLCSPHIRSPEVVDELTDNRLHPAAPETHLKGQSVLQQGGQLLGSRCVIVVRQCHAI